MKKIYTLTLALLASTSMLAGAQSLSDTQSLWAKAITNSTASSTSQGSDMVLAKDGSIYITGSAGSLNANENILFGEDFMFMIEVCAVSERICYLPQHIGYHYYVNSHSLVQNTKKTAKELIQYAQGFKRIFDTMSKYGIDSNETRQSMIVPQGRFILGSPELTVEDRKTIKDLLYKYVVTMRLLPADKSSDIWRRTMSLAIAFDTILNPEDPGALFKQITTNGVKTLRIIMHNNANTDYGRKYVFERLDGIMAFRHRVPLSDAETNYK